MSRYEGEWVFSRIIEDRAERLGDKTFIHSDEGDITYGAVADRASRVAGALAGLGVAPGDRVATMLPAGTDYVAAWFGITWAGAVDVPVNNEYKGEFLRHLLADSEAEVMICQDRWLPRLAGLDLPDLRHVVVVGGSEDTPSRAGRLTVRESCWPVIPFPEWPAPNATFSTSCTPPAPPGPQRV